MKIWIALAGIVLTALGGCQSAPPIAQPEPAPAEQPDAAPAPAPVAPPPPPPVPTPAERALDEGIALYDKGDFNGAIKRILAAKEIWTDANANATANKLTAHKYVAFSYCVTKRRTQCRKQFVDALKLDAAFTLDPAEKTHPIWGPEFERAKKEATAAAAAPAKGKAATTKTSPSSGKTQ